MILRFLVLLLVLGGAIGGIGYLKWQQMQAGAAQMSHAMPPATIASTEVATETWRPALKAVGSLVAVNGIEVSAEVNGTVRKLRFDSGQQVKTGQVLVELDDTVDQAALAALRAEQRLAQIEFDRARELLPKKAVSRADYDKAQAGLQAAAARVTQQEAVIARKSLRAPFDGILGIRKIDLGQYLNPGEPIVELQSIDPVHVDFQLAERHLSGVGVGMEVEVITDAWPGETFRGTVTAIGNGIVAGTRTVQVRATIANQDGRLRPGMFAEVRALQPETRQVLTIPRTAVSFNTYGDFVYVLVEADGKLTAKRRQIETGQSRDGRIVVTKGLEVGERVVRAGLVKLRDGAAVQVDNSVQLDDTGGNGKGV